MDSYHVHTETFRFPDAVDDPLRTGRLCVWSCLWASPVGHWWFALLDNIILPRSPASLLAATMKMAVDQTFMAPIGVAVFFMSIKVDRNALFDFS